MAKVETEKLTGAALDWAVALATGLKPADLYINNGGGRQYISIFRKTRDEDGNLTGYYMTGPDLLFSHKWEAAGPLIEKARIGIREESEGSSHIWIASIFNHVKQEYEYVWTGDTILEAAMRCYVATKFGREVEIPNKLLELMK